jgi:hypothetical protein
MYFFIKIIVHLAGWEPEEIGLLDAEPMIGTGLGPCEPAEPTALVLLGGGDYATV